MRFAIVAYPELSSDLNHYWLSFTERRAKYCLGIGGRFRIVDFLFSIARQVDAPHILMYQTKEEENLHEFLQNYLVTNELMRLHLLQNDLHDFLADTMKVIKSSRIDAVIMYNADTPVLFDVDWMVNKFIETNKPLVLFNLKNPSKRYFDGDRSKFRVLFAKRETFLNQLEHVAQLKSRGRNVFEQLMNLSSMQDVPTITANGLYGILSTVSDYYSFNIKLLKYLEGVDKIFEQFRLGSFMPKKGTTTIGKDGVVYRSIISENSRIDGMVIDSIIFPGVHIEKGAEIVGSVILPNNWIGSGAKVYHALVEEASPRSSKDMSLNIGSQCSIGRLDNYSRGSNLEYPESIKDGLTVIGRDCSIPKKVKIGANCFISPETNRLKIKMYNRVTDGAVL